MLHRLGVRQVSDKLILVSYLSPNRNMNTALTIISPQPVAGARPGSPPSMTSMKNKRMAGHHSEGDNAQIFFIVATMPEISQEHDLYFTQLLRACSQHQDGLNTSHLNAQLKGEAPERAWVDWLTNKTLKTHI